MYRDVKGYEGLYQVSDEGHVISLPRTIINKNGREQYYPGKKLKPDVTNKGYYRVTLCKNHKTKRVAIHRLVGLHFIPNPENKPDINHIDNITINNESSNLEWCTHSENMLHAQRQGRLYAAQSKGGRTRGQSGLKADKIIQDLIGSQINNWTILSFNEYRGTKKYFNVKCTCGEVTTREQSYLMNASQRGCIHCKTIL